MTTTLAPELPRTARRARQLVAVSERTTLDPFTEVDWDISIDDSAFHLPPEVLPLYGTEAWQAMSEQERIAYSRHETAALCGAGIWFENVLMQAVLRHLQELPVTDPAHRYLLVEVADECRHSMMFGEFIRRADTPAYRPAMNPLTVSDLPGGRAMSYLLILAVEELLDHINRATMRDERVHPVHREPVLRGGDGVRREPRVPGPAVPCRAKRRGSSPCAATSRIPSRSRSPGATRAFRGSRRRRPVCPTATPMRRSP